MKIITIVSFLVAIILFSYLVSANVIDNFNTEIEMEQEGFTKIINTIILDSTNFEGFVYIPVYNPEELVVTGNDKELKYAILGGLALMTPDEKIDNYKIKLEYLTNSLTSKEDDKWILKYEIPPVSSLNYDKINDISVTFKFPSNSKIIENSEGNVVYTEGNKLIYGWKVELKEKESTEIQTTYELMYVNAKTKENILTILVIILISGILIFIIYKTIDKYYVHISKGKKDIMKTLDKKEKEVLSLLLNNKKNKLTQSYIHKETGISKATLSRIIRKLKFKNIIETRVSGNTNIILLSDWFKKK